MVSVRIYAGDHEVAYNIRCDVVAPRYPVRTHHCDTGLIVAVCFDSERSNYDPFDRFVRTALQNNP